MQGDGGHARREQRWLDCGKMGTRMEWVLWCVIFDACVVAGVEGASRLERPITCESEWKHVSVMRRQGGRSFI